MYLERFKPWDGPEMCGMNWTVMRLSRLVIGVGVLLSMLLALGCTTTAIEPVRTELVPFTPEEKAQLLASSSAQYRLRAGDRVGVDFKYEDELDSSNLLILPDGQLSLTPK